MPETVGGFSGDNPKKKSIRPRVIVLTLVLLLSLGALAYACRSNFSAGSLKPSLDVKNSLSQDSSVQKGNEPASGLMADIDQGENEPIFAASINDDFDNQLENIREELLVLENKLTKLSSVDKLSLSGGELTGTLDVSDTLTLNDTAKTESIIPQSDDSYDLGSSSKGWDNVYVHRLFGSSILTIGGGETSHNLTNTDDLLVSGDLEVNGDSYFDGNTIFAGTISVGGSAISNLGTPTQDSDAATKAYVDANSGGDSYFQRTGTAISPLNSGDSLNLTGSSITFDSNQLFGGSTLTQLGYLNNISGLGTLAQQTASNVSITGGLLSNISSLNGISDTTLAFLSGVSSDIQVQITGLDSSKEDSLTKGNVSGTADQITVTGDAIDAVIGSGITLSLPQSIATTSSPTFGGLTLSGVLNMGANAIQNIGADGTDFSGTGGLTLADALTVSGGGIDVTGTATFNNTVDMLGLLNVTGDTTLVGELDVTGDASFFGDLAISGNTTFSGAIVSGNSTISTSMDWSHRLRSQTVKNGYAAAANGFFGGLSYSGGLLMYGYYGPWDNVYYGYSTNDGATWTDLEISNFGSTDRYREVKGTFYDVDADAIYLGLGSSPGKGGASIVVCKNYSATGCDSLGEFVNTAAPVGSNISVWTITKINGHIYAFAQGEGPLVVVCKPSGFSAGGADSAVCDHANDWENIAPVSPIANEAVIIWYPEVKGTNIYAANVYGSDPGIIRCDYSGGSDPNRCEASEWTVSYSRNTAGYGPISNNQDGFVASAQYNGCLYYGWSRNASGGDPAELWRCCESVCDATADWSKVYTFPALGGAVDEVSMLANWQDKLIIGTGEAGAMGWSSGLYVLNDDDSITDIGGQISGEGFARLIFPAVDGNGNLYFSVQKGNYTKGQIVKIMSDTGGFSKFQGMTARGFNMPMLWSTEAINKTANISDTFIMTPPVDGLYKVILYIVPSQTNTDAGDTVSVSVNYSDGVGVKTESNLINACALNAVCTAEKVIYAVGSDSISYQTTYSGNGSGNTADYNLHIVVERIK